MSKRPKYRIEFGDGWEKYAPCADGVHYVGVIHTTFHTGVTTSNALGVVKDTGRYVEVHGPLTVGFDGRTIAGALRKAGRSLGGRPRTVDSGRRYTLYLDEATISIAKRLGKGSVSFGVRRGMQVLADQMGFPEAGSCLNTIGGQK